MASVAVSCVCITIPTSIGLDWMTELVQGCAPPAAITASSSDNLIFPFNRLCLPSSSSLLSGPITSFESSVFSLMLQMTLRIRCSASLSPRLFFSGFELGELGKPNDGSQFGRLNCATVSSFSPPIHTFCETGVACGCRINSRQMCS